MTLDLQESKKINDNILEQLAVRRKIESITKGLRKPYFKNSLLQLLKRNIEKR
ncbi:MAG: hypothetical protein ACE5SW_04510 [Nitrososphaeraceae archaeon]